MLTREEALKLGEAIVIDRQESARLPVGHKGSCQVNSGMFVMRNRESSRYCIGFVAGTRGQYEPHAWVKQHDKYLECSPQDGAGLDYILVEELSYDQMVDAARKAGLDTSEGFIPPLLDGKGEFVWLPPDADARQAG